ncbi:MAG: hypothetical protein AB1324_02495 [Candidatus Micrarchaeota archaeon]
MRLAVMAIALLFLAFASSAIIVGPPIYEQDDFGDISWSEFTYSISADCTAGTITLIVMNESNKPVKDANTYLKYIDFSQPLLSNVVSDKDGYTLHKLPGNVQLMRGLFIFVIEKSGYRTKEIHFDLYPCFHNGSMPPPKPVPKPPPSQNGYEVQVPPPKNNTTTAPPPVLNVSGNMTNGSGTEEPPAPESACPSLFALGALAAFSFIMAGRDRTHY